MPQPIGVGRHMSHAPAPPCPLQQARRLLTPPKVGPKVGRSGRSQALLPQHSGRRELLLWTVGARQSERKVLFLFFQVTEHIKERNARREGRTGGHPAAVLSAGAGVHTHMYFGAMYETKLSNNACQVALGFRHSSVLIGGHASGRFALLAPRKPVAASAALPRMQQQQDRPDLSAEEVRLLERRMGEGGRFTQKQMFREEIESPFRKTRLFLVPALAASAALGVFIRCGSCVDIHTRNSASKNENGVSHPRCVLFGFLTVSDILCTRTHA